VKLSTLIGAALFMGVGGGETFSWLLLRGECPNAPGMIALSTFGPGMMTFGALCTAYLVFRRRRL